MQNKSIISLSIISTAIFIPSLLVADLPKGHAERKIIQIIEQKKPDETCVFTPAPAATDKDEILFDRAIQYGSIVVKGAFWYVVIGGTVFTVATVSLALHMVLQLYSRNP